MDLLTSDVLPPVQISVVGRSTDLTLAHGVPEHPVLARDSGVLVVMHVHAKPVELWWMLSHLVLLLALEVEDHCLIRQRAELVREVLLRGVVVPAVARVGRWML